MYRCYDMDAGLGGKIIKLTKETGFSLGVLAKCIYEVRGSRGGAIRGVGGLPGLL